MRSFFSTSSTPTPTPSPSPPLPHAPYNTSSKRFLARTKLVLCDTSCLASSTVTQLTTATPKYALECASDDEDEDEDEDEDDIAVTVTVRPVGSPSSSVSSFSSTSTSSDFRAAMSIRTKAKRQAKDAKDAKDSLSASNPPNGTTAGHGRPATTPTSPVQIPKRSHRDNARHMKKENVHRNQRRQPKHVGSLGAISPSVAALLAMTDIPRPPHRRRHLAERNLSVDEVMSDQHDSEKDASSSSLCRGPLDLLLSPPDDLADDDLSATESNVGSLLARTISADSVPSLGGESFATDFGSSIDTPGRVSTSARRRHSPMRKSLEPVRSPPDATEEHPLAGVDGIDLEELLELPSPAKEESTSYSYPSLQPFKPLRFAFKSNLTASLRALRSAAKSFSSINFPTIPTDDLLTRSILTIDPNVPYMDERRPPVTEEMPSAELRRYLNPTTSSHLDPRPKARTNGPFSASIQMQTYKVQRSRSAPPCSPRTTPPYVPGNAPPSASPSNNGGDSNHHQQQQQQHQPTQQHPQQHPAKAGHQAAHVPGMRQREMRENPDFIRIAVMEMAMRRRGKLDDQKTGRARWALPPRRPSAKPYEVGSNGVPSRWIPVTYGPY